MDGVNRRRLRIAFLVRRDGQVCYLCKRALTDDGITLDHVIPRARGGADNLWNLKLACGPCNNAKADTMPQGVRVPSARAELGCVVCRNGRRLEDFTCWACGRRNERLRRPVAACRHVDTWCVSCLTATG